MLTESKEGNSTEKRCTTCGNVQNNFIILLLFTETYAKAESHPLMYWTNNNCDSEYYLKFSQIIFHVLIFDLGVFQYLGNDCDYIVNF